MIECDECKETFELDSIKESEVLLNGVKVILVYFTCPKCNRIYKISVQDKKYYDIQKELDAINHRIEVQKKKKNSSVLGHLISLAKNKKKRLASHILKVNKKFSGTFTFKSSENNQKEIIYRE